MRTITVGKEQEVWELGEDFTILKVVGVGSYGTVCQVRHEPTKTILAVKRIRDLFDSVVESKRILREICILKNLSHPSIVKLHEILEIKNRKAFDTVYLVMEYAELDLSKLTKSSVHLGIAQVRKVVYGILVGLKHMHSRGVLHRDIKPANILFNKDCTVRICDFGLARTTAGIEGVSLKTMRKPKEEVKKALASATDEDKKEETREEAKARRKLSGHVATRWYRAPEIILMEDDYGPAVDVWAVGCVFGELLGRMRGNVSKEALQLFPGTSCFPLSPMAVFSFQKGHFQYLAKDQLSLIISTIGSPAKSDASFITNPKVLEYLQGFKKQPSVNLNSKYPAAGKDAIDLLANMLKFNPFARITVDQCIAHPFFASIRDAEVERMEGEEMELEFEEENLDKEKLRKEYLRVVDCYSQLRKEGKIAYK
eukprot:TRINITY_DN1293_c0_g7_i1.p1 TRINITY_DN1293_c0_g7~~TRINITY_DN1293_c0_g7_i1.p1  ORF type:complete len:426 (+),score=141.22 TRINITY_DN1293_c0_g7_i1:98-1375(+)